MVKWYKQDSDEKMPSKKEDLLLHFYSTCMRPDLPAPQLPDPPTLQMLNASQLQNAPMPDLPAPDPPMLNLPQLQDALMPDLPAPDPLMLNEPQLQDAPILPDALLLTPNAGDACNGTGHNYGSNEKEVAQILLGTIFVSQQVSIADDVAAIGV